MVPQLNRIGRFSAPVREMSFADLDENNNDTPVLRTRAPSPSSVRCSLDKTSKQSLLSFIKPQDSLPSFSASDSSSLSSSRRKVGFEAWVGVKNTISRYDMTEEEVENCWLGDDEYVEIRRRNRMVIRHGESFYQLGEPLPDDSYYNEDYSAEDIEQKEDGDYLCIRGLESSSKSGSIRKKTYRRNSIQQVLVEQEYQRVQGFHDETAISELYIEHTSPSKFRAVHLAMEDRIAAER